AIDDFGFFDGWMGWDLLRASHRSFGFSISLILFCSAQDLGCLCYLGMVKAGMHASIQLVSGLID
ncbi:hypothetical protein BDW59DRAFT_148802, partial [Aspergillus cavernicola]